MLTRKDNTTISFLFPLLAAMLWCCCGLALAGQNSVKDLRILSSAGNTQVVLDLTHRAEYSYFSLTNPHRLVVDLANSRNQVALDKVVNPSKLIKKIRLSTPKNKQATRFVLELNKPLKATLRALAAAKPYGNRLLIEFPDPDSVQSDVRLNRQHNQRDRDIIIAIDAGHGGQDPGSIGSAGSYEKNVTLSVAKKLAARVDKEQGLRAVLTRSGDYYISPNKRPEIARKHKADLLVSIHADAFTTPQPRGASVWVLSMGRADNELGRWIEKSERHSELLGGAAEVINDKASERWLTETILGLSMDHSMATSYDLSKDVIAEMKKVTRMHKRQPQAASLAVLTSPDIPSILVETGFISNPQEEKNLNWSKFRGQLADAIFAAVKKYFRDNPPDGTLWANLRKAKRTHKVRSGESLSLLAQRYNTKVSKIKQLNNLHSDRVRIGQVLTIPST